MTTTVFVDSTPTTPGTEIVASWLNDVNVTVYTALGAGGVAPTTAAQVRTNLDLVTGTVIAATYAPLANPTFTGTVTGTFSGAHNGTVGATTPNTGAFTSLTSSGGITASGGGISSTSATAKIGYGTGAGTTVTQLTSKSTGVTSNTPSGIIVMNNAALNGNTAVSFALSCSAIGTGTVVLVTIQALNATANAYTVDANDVAAGTCNITLTNRTGGALSEAVRINYTLFSAAAS